ncbi:hypothetical protein IQ07DRAFT_293068 [Pyrenochaeta sp. DS3sAY3a]|nr:hypothetical protein IQ07DRAFT_293068 [Pyrenochaeta sp. DS3sAY3a]
MLKIAVAHCLSSPNVSFDARQIQTGDATPRGAVCKKGLEERSHRGRFYQGLKLVNVANYKALDVILDKAHPGHRISAVTILHFRPPARILLAAETTKDFNFVSMPPGTILLTLLSSKLERVKRRLWQRHDVTRRGLLCIAAFACTDYKVKNRRVQCS